MLVVLFRIHQDASAVLADYHLAVGRNLDEPLRRDSVHTAAAGVAVIYSYNCKMVMAAAADTVISAESARIDLRHISFTRGAEPGLLLGSGLHDGRKFFTLCFEVSLLYFSLFLENFESLLLVENLLLGLANHLLGYLTEEFLVLEFLLERIELTAVGNSIELVPVLLDLGLAFDNVVFACRYAGREGLDIGRNCLLLDLYIGELALESGNFERKFAPELEYLVDV